MEATKYSIDARTIDGKGGIVHIDHEGNQVGFTPINDLDPEWVEYFVFDGPMMRFDVNHGTVQFRESEDDQWKDKE